MNSINNNLIDFFKQLNDITNDFVTTIEVKPIRIKKDMYISGFKRNGLSFFETHIKHIKPLMLKTNESITEMVLKEIPESEMWMDVELLEPTIVQTALNELKNYFNNLNDLEILQIQYKLKTEPNNLAIQEETIIYDNKKIACKDAIAKRKLCSLFKTHFTHLQTQYTPSDEEIAEMA